jgi:hypothetical protein
MLVIEFQRAFSEEDLRVGGCGICGHDFYPSAVLAKVTNDSGRIDLGEACRSCVAYLADRNPEAFPTVEEHDALLERYPEPIWPSPAAAGRAEVDLGTDRFNEALKEANVGIRGYRGA